MPACYLHPARETGRSCAVCARPICLECMDGFFLGARCRDCKAAGRKRRRGPAGLTDVAAAAPLTTLYLVVVNVAIFAILASLEGGWLGEENRYVMDAAVSAEGLRGGEVWRLVTSGFVHLDVVHLVSNMVVLAVAGTMLEAVASRVEYVLIYAVSLLGGAFGAVLIHPDAASAGASGAIFGLVVAGVTLLNLRGGSRAREYGTILLILLAQNLFLTFDAVDVSVGGHIGGSQAGAVIGLALSRHGWTADLTAGLRVMLGVAIACFLAAMSLLVASAAA